jgi:effector-binding domain-containing protein
MWMKRNLACLAFGFAVALAGPAAPQVAAPAPVESAPLPPPGSGAPPATPGATAGRPTLVPASPDTADVAEVSLPAKPAAVVSGTSSWDDGVDNMKKAFRTIEDELAKAGIAPAGRPLTVFVQTDDASFRFDAMVPIASAPAGQSSLSPAVRIAQTPAGRALRFEHKGPYDVIDTTYETITAYLDAKGLTVEDAFVEEYVTDLTDASDPNLEVNIYALLR